MQLSDKIKSVFSKIFNRDLSSDSVKLDSKVIRKRNPIKVILIVFGTVIILFILLIVIFFVFFLASNRANLGISKLPISSLVKSSYISLRNKTISVGVSPKVLPIPPASPDEPLVAAPAEVQYEKIENNKYRYTLSGIVRGEAVLLAANKYKINVELLSGQVIAPTMIDNQNLSYLIWQKEFLDVRVELKDLLQGSPCEQFCYIPSSAKYIKDKDNVVVIWETETIPNTALENNTIVNEILEKEPPRFLMVLSVMDLINK